MRGWEATSEVGRYSFSTTVSGSKIKLLHAEPGGLVLYEKLLEEGTFKIPAYNPATRSYPMTWSDLVVMVEGINEDVSKGRQRRLSNLKKHW